MKFTRLDLGVFVVLCLLVMLWLSACCTRPHRHIHYEKVIDYDSHPAVTNAPTR